MVNTMTGYVAVFANQTHINATGSNLITAFTINSPDGKNLSKYDLSLVGYWDMETTI